MTGLPSILLGVFAYDDHRDRWREVGHPLPARSASPGSPGAVALAVLMVPIIMKASEASLRSVPVAVREAGLALGARKGVVARRVIIPTALPGLITAVLLAIARAIGETAPLLWCIGASIYNPLRPGTRKHPNSCDHPADLPSRRPRRILRSATSAWGMALFLVVVVLILNLGCRLSGILLQRERR